MTTEPSTDDLREQIAAALSNVNCVRIEGGRVRRPFAAKSPMAFTFADAALAVVAPLLAAKAQELERAKADRLVSAIFGTREPTCPKAFALYRHEDVTGASGTGLVATGVQFDDGTTVVRWRGETPSTVVWPSLEAAEAVDGHGGRTHVVWLQEDIVDTCAAVERDMEAKYGARVAELTRERDQWREAYEQKLADFARETARVSRALAACDRSIGSAAYKASPVGEAGLGWLAAQEYIEKAIRADESGRPAAQEAPTSRPLRADWIASLAAWLHENTDCDDYPANDDECCPSCWSFAERVAGEFNRVTEGWLEADEFPVAAQEAPAPPEQVGARPCCTADSLGDVGNCSVCGWISPPVGEAGEPPAPRVWHSGDPEPVGEFPEVSP